MGSRIKVKQWPSDPPYVRVIESSGDFMVIVRMSMEGYWIPDERTSLCLNGECITAVSASILAYRIRRLADEIE